MLRVEGRGGHRFQTPLIEGVNRFHTPSDGGGHRFRTPSDRGGGGVIDSRPTTYHLLLSPLVIINDTPLTWKNPLLKGKSTLPVPFNFAGLNCESENLTMEYCSMLNIT